MSSVMLVGGKQPCPHGCIRGYITWTGQMTCPECKGTGRDLSSDLWHAPCRKSNCINGKVPVCGRDRCPIH